MAANRILGLVVLLSLAGCESEPTAAEKAAQEAHDIAQVKAIQDQKPPARPVQLQPIGFPDIEQHNLYGAGCNFAPGGSIGAVLLGQNKAAYIKVNGKIVRLASDPGSAQLPLGAWSHYVGKEYAVSLTLLDGPPEPAGSETVRWQGHLTLTDPNNQIVYSQDGLVQCGS